MDYGEWWRLTVDRNIALEMRERCEGVGTLIPSDEPPYKGHHTMTGFVADLQDDRIKHLEKQVERLTRYFAHHMHGPNDKLLIPMEEINELQNIDADGRG